MKMNEIVDKIAYQSGLYCDGTPDGWDEEAIMRFTYGIVEQCLTAIESIPYKRKNQTNWAKDAIKEHFSMKIYNEEYDSYYDANKNEWLEKTCSDPTCEFCSARPSNPLTL